MDYELSENGIIDIYYIDLINRMPIAELITEKEDSATTKKFYKKQHQSNRVHCNCNGFKTRI